MLQKSWDSLCRHRKTLQSSACNKYTPSASPWPSNKSSTTELSPIVAFSDLSALVREICPGDYHIRIQKRNLQHAITIYALLKCIFLSKTFTLLWPFHYAWTIKNCPQTSTLSLPDIVICCHCYNIVKYVCHMKPQMLLIINKHVSTITFDEALYLFHCSLWIDFRLRRLPSIQLYMCICVHLLYCELC